jgi:hypothetical protein
MIKKIALTVALVAGVSALEVGEIVKPVTLTAKDGVQVKNNSSWSSDSLKGRVSVIFYVDPDEKDANSKFSKIIEEQKFDKKSFVKVAIVNLAATWKPNFVISKLLASKQKDLPDNIYLKDKSRFFVKEWNLKDDASDVIILSKEGKVLFSKSGAMSSDEIEKALEIVKKAL